MLSAMGLAAAASLSPATGTDDLLDRLTNLERLIRIPTASSRTIEFSSYDRRSKATGTQDWFANDDFGQYLRTETRGGRTEHVMAEAGSAGAVVRIWSANPQGIVRFYLDGSESPAIEERFEDLLFKGAAGPLGPLAMPALRGGNLYYPIPYNTLKITISQEKPDDRLDRMYYQIQTVSLPGQVEAFRADRASRFRSERAAMALKNPAPRGTTTPIDWRLTPGGRGRISFAAPGPQGLAVTEWTIRLSSEKPIEPARWQTMLSRLEARIITDGRRTLALPLAGLFGAGVLPADHATYVSSSKTVAPGVEELSLRLPIPCREALTLEVLNHNDGPPLRVAGLARTAPMADEGTLAALHGQWSADFGRTRPFRDLVMMDFRGRGRYVGTVLHVQNKSKKWWGEGDEKVWVDGEAFPSWFGTGTEDYFGYAWSSWHWFSAPYMAQARADGPANAGQIGNVRWHVIDDIPFEKSLRFAMEIWHWDDAECRFAGSALWYAAPSRWQAPVVDPELAEVIDASPESLPRLPGALEGEELKVVRRPAGSLTIQDYFTYLSGGAQIWWADAPVGSTIAFQVPVAEAGRYKLAGILCHAKDYGRHRIRLNGRELFIRDFYSLELKWERIELGEFDLPAGMAELSFEVLEPNPLAEPKNMLGIDCLFLTKTGGHVR